MQLHTFNETDIGDFETVKEILEQGGHLEMWSMGYWIYDKDHNKIGNCTDRLVFYFRQLNNAISDTDSKPHTIVIPNN